MTPHPPHYRANHPIELPASGPWPPAVHRFTAPTVAALRAAEATNRPLLIRGKPGVGKSMTARAAAFEAAPKRPFLSRVIDSRTEPDDLKAHFDAVRRLADAQVHRDGQHALASDASYLLPRELWWAFNWKSAQDQHALFCKRLQDQDRQLAARVPIAPAGWCHTQHRAVLLLDEIDKADPELPNALLEAFGSNGFAAPVTGELVSCEPSLRPLVILTTNEERELPSAFLRRCLVLWLALPDDEDELVAELVRIGEQHQSWLLRQPEGHGRRAGQCKVIERAARAVAAARRELADSSYQPGTSEFLDLVGALAELAPDDEAAQTGMLDTLQQFVLHKAADPMA